MISGQACDPFVYNLKSIHSPCFKWSTISIRNQCKNVSLKNYYDLKVWIALKKNQNNCYDESPEHEVEVKIGSKCPPEVKTIEHCSVLLIPFIVNFRFEFFNALQVENVFNHKVQVDYRYHYHNCQHDKADNSGYLLLNYGYFLLSCANFKVILNKLMNVYQSANCHF